MFQTSFWLSSESPRHTIRPEDDVKELHRHSQTEQKEFLVGKQITPNCPGLSSIVSTQYSNISFLYLNIRFLSSSEKKKNKAGRQGNTPHFTTLTNLELVETPPGTAVQGYWFWFRSDPETKGDKQGSGRDTVFPTCLFRLHEVYLKSVTKQLLTPVRVFLTNHLIPNQWLSLSYESAHVSEWFGERRVP